jgi:polyisoprenoid-binding protein YceI
MTNRWNIDAAYSGIHFSIRHMVFSKVRGRFGTYTGTIELDDGDFTRSRVEASIDAASIDTGTAQRDVHLRSPDFLDVEKFPQLRFRSTRIEKVGADRYDVIGELSIRDVTREVTLDVEASGKGKDPWGNERFGFIAKTAIDRREFGLQWNQVLEAGGVLVGDRVDIELEVQAVKAVAKKAA